MPEEIRVNRPSQIQPPVGNRGSANQGSEPVMQRGNTKAPWIILAVVVVVLVVLGVLFRSRLLGNGRNTGTSDVSDYTAVFLTNGQVYFGKLADANSQYPDLTDIYYLQVGPQQGNGSAAQTTTNQPQSVSLVKLGNELHGPIDEMHINRNQILFYEQLKKDGQVVKAIMAYKANPTGTTAVPGQQQQTPATPTVPSAGK